jgi:hypothetical protein
MTMHEASRTLVKSTPELWAECSDGESLARHLGAFGEIRITKLEPETAVAWEGDEVRGTVTFEPAGWGTRVVLTATPGEGSAATSEAEPVVGEEAEPEVAAEPTPEPELAYEPEAVAGPEPPAEPEAEGSGETEAEPTPRPGFFARLFGRRRRPNPESGPLGEEDPLIDLASGTEPEPEREQSLEFAAAEPAAEPATPPEPPSPPAPELEVLLSALDSLGTAHRRPFSHS